MIEGDAGRMDQAGIPRRLDPNRNRVVIGFIGFSGIAYRVFNNVVLASVLLFTVRIYLRIRPLFRAPGYQDIMYGECVIPYCDQISIVITLILSALIYYSIAVFLD